MPIVNNIKERYLRDTGRERLLAESERKFKEGPKVKSEEKKPTSVDLDTVEKPAPVNPDLWRKEKMEKWRESTEREI